VRSACEYFDDVPLLVQRKHCAPYTPFVEGDVCGARLFKLAMLFFELLWVLFQSSDQISDRRAKLR